MSRKAVLGIGPVVLAAVEAAAAGVAPRVATYVESFEAGFGGWRPDHHIDCEADDTS